MNLIIPMAGIGKRMRPHTLLIPKPLLKIAGKSIVERIVEDIKYSSGKSIEEVHFIIGNFGNEVEANLLEIASNINAKGYIHFQNEALGTAHAIYCAKDGLEGEILIAFADTLFVGNFEINSSDEAIIWTMEVKNPENYGVVEIDKNENIIGFIEKPKDFVSNKAIIGIYYFKNGGDLKRDIKFLIDNNFKTSGEFQLTDNLKNLKESGLNFKCKLIDEWLDCGNKNEFLKSNHRILELKKFENKKAVVINSKVPDNIFIGNNVEIINSTIGYYVSIGENCRIINSEINESIISNDCNISDCNLVNSMIGSFNNLKRANGIVNFGDFVDYEGM